MYHILIIIMKSISSDMTYIVHSSMEDIQVFLIEMPYKLDCRLFLKGEMIEARLIIFYKIINGFAEVPFEDIIINAHIRTQ